MEQTTAAFPLPPDDWKRCATAEEVLQLPPPPIPESFAAFGEPRPSVPALDARSATELIADLRAATQSAIAAYTRILRGSAPEDAARDVGAAFSSAAAAVNGLRALECLVSLRDELSLLVNGERRDV